MEILFKVQPTLPSKNKIAPDLSEHDYISFFFQKLASRRIYKLKKIEIYLSPFIITDRYLFRYFRIRHDFAK
jgi:hypothetical protein